MTSEALPGATAPVMTPLDWALAYAAAGFPVFPVHAVREDGCCDCSNAKCRDKGKHPWTRHGLKEATTDPAIIRRWWGELYPNANVGIRTGDLGDGTYLFVLDEDPDKGGHERLQALVTTHGALPKTRVVCTGGGGRHSYFRGRLPGKTTSGVLGRGLDTRGGGGAHGAGYVVAPPSTHASGRRYAWLDGAPAVLAAPPAWLLELANGGKPAAPSAAAAAVDEPIFDGQVQGIGRKATLISLGRGMWARSMSEAAIRAALTTENAARCVPPLSLDDVERMVREVVKVAPGLSPEYAAKRARTTAAHLRIAENDGPESDEGTAPEEAPGADRPRLRAAADVVAALGPERPHLSTGVPTLDEATDGGPRAGDVVLFLGAPGTGKTTLAMNVVRHAALERRYVGVLAADEAIEGLITRLGQDAFGFDQGAIERRDPATMRELRERLAAEMPHLLVGDCSDGYVLEDVVEDLCAAAGAQPPTFVLDSVQRVRAYAADGAKDERMRIAAVVAACKAAAARGCLVLATCEQSRAAYRSRDAAERIDDLASGMGTNAIEYGATLMVVLRSVPDEGDLVDVTVPKNRVRGHKPAFRLRLDRGAARFREVPRPEEPSADAQRRAAAATAQAEARRIVLDVVRKHPNLTSRESIWERTGIGRTRAWAAINGLLDDGVLVQVNEKFRVAKPEDTRDDD